MPMRISIISSDMPTVSSRSARMRFELDTLLIGVPWTKTRTPGFCASKSATVRSSCRANLRAACESYERNAGASHASATVLSGQKKWPAAMV